MTAIKKNQATVPNQLNTPKQFPKSRKVYVEGFHGIRVPLMTQHLPMGKPNTTLRASIILLMLMGIHRLPSMLEKDYRFKKKLDSQTRRVFRVFSSNKPITLTN